MDKFSLVRDLERFLANPENEFLDLELKEKSESLSESITLLLNWMISSFFIWPEKQSGGNYRLCMYPFWNSDRGGDWDPDKSSKYDEANKELNRLAKSVDDGYKDFRKSVKQKLYL